MGQAGAFKALSAAFLNAFDKVLTRIEHFMMAVVCTFLFVVMVMVSADAVSRYALNSPLIFTFDLVTMYFLPGILFLSLSATMRKAGHIAVDLFANLMPVRVYQVVVGVGFLVSLVLIGIMAEQVTLKTYESWEMGLIVTGLYAWPIWLGEGIVAFALTVLSLRIGHIGLANLVAGLFGVEDVAVRLLHTSENPIEEPV